MKIERLREQVEVFNKLDGKMYKVTGVDNQVGTAAEMLEDGTLGENTVTITEANCLAFRVVKDPAPLPTPADYYVEDGQLMKNGQPACEQGQIVVKEILAKLPGILVLAVEPKSKEDGMIDLFAYEPARDRFKKLIRSSIPQVKVVGYAGADKDEAVLAYSKTVEKTEKDQDGNDVPVLDFDSAAVITVKGTAAVGCRIDCPINTDDTFIAERPDGAFEVYVPSDEDVNAVDDKVEKREKRMWLRIVDGQITDSFNMDGQITATWSPAYKEFVIRSDGEIYLPWMMFTMASKKIKQLAGYNVLIDVTKEDYAYKLTFSNGDYKFKTLTSQSTKDRGYIVTVA